MTIDYAHARELMVEQQIRPWDVLDIKAVSYTHLTLPTKA